jgi:hypothetical protein
MGTVRSDHLIGYWSDKLQPPNPIHLKYMGSDVRHSFFIRWAAKQ